ERPHVGARHEQRIADPDDPQRRRRGARGGLAVDGGAVLAAEVGDDAAPTLERDPRVAARDAPVVDLARAAVPPPDPEEALGERHGPRARRASREHQDHAGDLLAVTLAVVSGGAGGQGRRIHAERDYTCGPGEARRTLPTGARWPALPTIGRPPPRPTPN